jgi:hypothetical protein
MFTVTEILLSAGIRFRPYPRAANASVFLSDANQLFGAFKHLAAYRRSDAAYRGWHSHHVVEIDDLHRLGVTTHAPHADDQLCVLLPERAHIGRINSILRRENPARWHASATELREAYANAYALVGDYTGGGERQIRAELLAIVDAQFQKFGVS